jgi:glucose/arabinose dehydrogenase
VGIASAQDAPTTNRASAPDASQVALVEVATGYNRPLLVTNANDGSNRLFVMEQGGVIYVREGEAQSIFLDVSELLTWDVAGGGYTERGLLGLAFSPNFAENDTFFINYTDTAGATIVARYRVLADNPNMADPASAEIILKVDQPFPNHNGGHLAFGKDGYLYVGMGDGGAANDPLGAGQNLAMLLGKMLRLDVSGETGYSIPLNNPFLNTSGALPEIWAYGVRNPWRFTFDRATGDMYMGDVGQNLYEEINFQSADSAGGENYGWNAYEATQVFNRNVTANNPVMPIAEYQHGNLGCSVTAGYVYRGTLLPDLDGVYFYSDYCSGVVWAAYRDLNGVWNTDIFLETGFGVSSFGEDEDGELYIVDYSGRVLKFVSA